MKLIMLKIIKEFILMNINEKDSRFKSGDRVRISKFKNIFAKGYTPNWSKEILLLIK